MKGAIFYAGRYGSTAQYSRWIGEATGLPAYDVKDEVDPAGFDFLVVGSSVMYYKLSIRKWLRAHADVVRSKPTILFTVSGAGAGVKLDGWVADSLPTSLLSQMDHFALRGRWRPEDLSWFTRMMLFMGSLTNRDPQARKDERKGFDYVDKTSIDPIVDKVHELQTVAVSTEGAAAAETPALSPVS